MFCRRFLCVFVIAGVLCSYNTPAFASSEYKKIVSLFSLHGKNKRQENLTAVQPAHINISITADIKGEPLEIAFRDLSSRLPVELTVSRDCADQRITLCVTGQMLPRFMENVASTLSHGATKPEEYVWVTTPGNGSGKTVYQLRRTSAARVAERRELDKPRSEALQRLLDMRSAAQRVDALYNKATLTSHEQAIVSYGLDGYNQAMKSLSDRQIKQLLDGTVLTITRPSAASEKPASTLVLQVFNVSERQHNPTKSSQFGLRVVNVNPNAWRGLNTALGYEKTGYLPEENDPVAKVYDLTPLLTAPGVTNEQRTDLAFILHTLSQVTGVSIYEEHFIRQVGLFFPDTKGLPLRKGTLPQLVNAICKHWEYQVSQTPSGDLLFWSRHWAQDKQSDISERTLAPWRQVLQKQGHFTEADYMDMARKLSYAQTYITLPFAFGIGENAPWTKSRAQTDTDWDRFTNLWGYTQYKQRYLTGALLPGERQAAQSPDGIALAELSSATQQKLLGELHFWNEAQTAAQQKGDFSVPGPTPEEISQSWLFLSKPNLSGSIRAEAVRERVGDLPYDPLTLDIKSNIGIRWD